MGAKLVIWSLKDIRECIETMTSSDMKFDFICFIEGARGLGKSTLTYKILSGLKVEMPFKPRRDLVYTREDTLKHLATKINGCIFSDEMINVAYKRDFYEQDQKELLKAFDMYRDSRNIFIGCIPKFIDLDIKIQKLCKLRITVIRRGIALLQMQNKSIYSPDPWDVKNNQRIESKWYEKGRIRPRYGQLTTIRGIIKFNDLSARDREIYDQIKKEKRSHVFAKYQDTMDITDPDKLFLGNLTKELQTGQMTKEEFVRLCKINHKKYESVRAQVNKRLKELHDTKSFQDYCLSKKRKERKDALGFKLTTGPEPETDVTQSNNFDTSGISDVFES